MKSRVIYMLGAPLNERWAVLDACLINGAIMTESYQTRTLKVNHGKDLFTVQSEDVLFLFADLHSALYTDQYNNAA